MCMHGLGGVELSGNVCAVVFDTEPSAGQAQQQKGVLLPYTCAGFQDKGEEGKEEE